MPDTARSRLSRRPYQYFAHLTYHIGGTAGNGVDYQTLSGTVTIRLALRPPHHCHAHRRSQVGEANTSALPGATVDLAAALHR